MKKMKNFKWRLPSKIFLIRLVLFLTGCNFIQLIIPVLPSFFIIDLLIALAQDMHDFFAGETHSDEE